MSLFDKLFGQVTWKELDQRNASGWEGMLGTILTYAGESVTPESASRISAYYRCKANISEAIGMLPFGVYEDKGGYGEPVPKHPMRKLIHAEPNPVMKAEAFRTAMTGNTLGYGNGYAEIERNNAGEAIGLYPIHPSRVEVKQTNDGDLYYLVSVEDKEGIGRELRRVRLDPQYMLHISAMSADGIRGMSLADLAAQTLGLRMGAAKYGASFFRNASRPSGVLTHPETVSLTPEQKADLRNRWQSVYGGAENVGRVAVLEAGGKFEKIGIDPNEAQFLETLDHTDLEICRWFNVPPWKIGIQDQAKGWGTVEATNTHYVQDTLMIWAVRWEQEVNKKLLGGFDSGLYSKINFDALLRADTKTRSELYKTMTSIGVYSVNDVRSKEDMKPIGEEGDKHLVQLNQTTLEKIGDEEEPEEEAMNSTPFGNSQEIPEDDDDTEEQDMAKRMRPVLLDIAARIERKSQNEANRLAKKHDTLGEFADAFGAFMAKHRTSNRDAFLPALQAVGIGMTAAASFVLGALHDDARGRMIQAYGHEASEDDIQKAAGVYADAIITLAGLKG